MSIQWFPGHMARAKRIIHKYLKLVNIVFELVDARLPLSSRNPLINDLLADKPRIIILSKADLADPDMTNLWIKWFCENDLVAVAVDLIRGQGINKVFLELNRTVKEKNVKGLLTTRCMVVGIPNVGKSMFINRLAGQKTARTGERPGVTRGEQWIKIDKDVELLDTPGVLWPKLGNKEVAIKLAATGAIKEEVFNPEEVTIWILKWLLENKPLLIKKHYSIDEFPREIEDLMELIGKKRGLIGTGGIVDRFKTSIHILKEFRNGKLGRNTLEKPLV